MSEDEIKRHYTEMSLRLLFEEQDWADFYAQEEAKLEEKILALMNEQKISRAEAEEVIRSRNKK